MPCRRPGSLWLRGVVACATVAAVAGCGSDPVRVADPRLEDADRAACRAFNDDLPDRLFDQERRLVAPAAAPGAAWGDPPIVLACGVEEPEGFDDVSLCVEVNGIGWFLPPSAEDDADDITVTAVGHRPRVSVDIPADYRPNGLASVLANLSPLVEEHLDLVDPCA